jgi:hypothetical protein
MMLKAIGWETSEKYMVETWHEGRPPPPRNS